MELRRRGDCWIWVGGLVPPGADAITIWSMISMRRRAADDRRLLAHELEHVAQWRRLGVVGFLRDYLGAYLRERRKGYGHLAAYRLIPLEIEAEAAARRFMAATEAEGPA